MVRYRRNLIAGGTYFFTATLADRTSCALVEHVDAFRAALQSTRLERPFTVDAVVILPDHLHIIMTLPAEDADYANRWRRIKRRFTNAVTQSGTPVAHHTSGEAALWQRRFWEHTIRDDSDFERHVDYIHFNPVRHGFVARVRDWPHSSFHRFVQQRLLPEDWAGDFGEDKEVLASGDGDPGLSFAQSGLRVSARARKPSR
jgi:putative transposase